MMKNYDESVQINLNQIGLIFVTIVIESSQLVNIGPKNVPTTFPSDIPRAFPKHLIWLSTGLPHLISWERPNLTSWRCSDLMSQGHPEPTSQGHPTRNFRRRLKDVMGRMLQVPKFCFFTELNAILRDVLKIHSGI